MSHPFGNLLTQYRSRKHGLTQSRLAMLAGYHPPVITRMAQGRKDLTGPSGRERVVRLMDVLRDEGALTTLDDANALLSAAQMPPLYTGQPAEAALIRRLGEAGVKNNPAKHPALDPRDAKPYPAGNLPAQLTRFVGRERELGELRQLLPTTRLLTLTGSGGVGKTRLALEFASQVLGDFPDGVWLVELAPLADAALVPRTASSVFHLTDEPGRTLTDLLAGYLLGRRLLLLLDNCEHVIGACAELVETLLRACPGLTVLATSREALRVPGEVSWRVPSLETPDPAHLPPLEQVIDYEAVELFVRGAAYAQPAFALAPGNVASIAQICYRLDGIPLAIEMAAACAAALSASEIAAALDDMFALLRRGRRTALPRQQTLRATLDWSYALLTEPERLLLAHLSVFAGGWRADAVKAVCGPDALPLMLGLVHKSLVVASPGDGVTRYRLLEPVRQYAAEKLGEWGDAELTAIHERHWAYYTAIGEVENSEDGHGFIDWTLRMDAELDNLRAAFEYAQSRATVDRGERMLRLALAATNYLKSSGHSDECRLWLDEALARGAAGPPPLRARALEARATLAPLHGQLHEAVTFVEASLALFRETDDSPATGWALIMRGLLALHLEYDPRAGLGYAEQALEQFGRSASSVENANALSLQGWCWLALGETERARASYAEAYRFFENARNFGDAADTLRYLARVDEPEAARLWARAVSRLRATADWEGLIGMLHHWGLRQMDRGDLERAIPLLKECLDLLQSEGVGPVYRMMRSDVEMDLGLAEYRAGRVDSAIAHHQAALRVAGQNALSATHRARYHYNLALYALACGDRASAERHAWEGLRYTHDSGNSALLALQLAQQAELACLRGDVAGAARVAGAASPYEDRIRHLVVWPASWIEYQRALHTVRSNAVDPESVAAWAEGEHMTLDQAVAAALALQGAEVDQPTVQ